MRISDWSSDVCSSDLLLVGETWHELGELRGIGDALLCKLFATCGGNRHRHVNQPLRPLLRRHDDLVHNDTTGVGRSRSRSEEHTSELQSLMRISYAVFCLKKKNTH